MLRETRRGQHEPSTQIFHRIPALGPRPCPSGLFAAFLFGTQASWPSALPQRLLERFSLSCILVLAFYPQGPHLMASAVGIVSKGEVVLQGCSFPSLLARHHGCRDGGGEGCGSVGLVISGSPGVSAQLWGMCCQPLWGRVFLG